MTAPTSLWPATVVVWLMMLPVATTQAQSPVSAAQPAALHVGVETQGDRIRYHFDNPSSADTPFLVPHFFEQQYVADNVWLVATASYTAGVPWETSAGTSSERTVRADDYDTFLDPGGVVLVSGTTGNASMRAFRISQRADVGRAGPVQVSVGYRLRWDRFDFHLGHKTVTRNGVLTAATDVTSPEMTDSKVHELFVGVRSAPAIGRAWRLALSGEISPSTLARLSVQLPEKYPGEDLVFFAQILSASARVALVRAGERWPLEIAIRVEHSWSYRSTARLSRSAQGVAISLGRTW